MGIVWWKFMLDWSRSILHILMKLLNFESLISQQAQEFVADLFEHWSMDTLIVCNSTIRNIYRNIFFFSL